MTNILNIIKIQEEKGFDLIDKNGDFAKSEKVKKDAYKAYNKGVQSGEIDPCEYDFKSYFSWYKNENYTETTDITNEIIEILTSDVEDIELEDTEQEG